MSNLANRFESTLVVQETAVVVERRDDVFVCDAGGGRYRAERALSCLVEPSVDDVVLLATEEGGRSTILAVLRRLGPDKTRLVAGGDVDLDVEGQLSVSARGGIALVSRETIRAIAKELKLNAVEGTVALQRASVVGQYLQTKFERVKTFAETLDTVTGRFSLKAQRSFRRIAGLDQTRAENIDMDADRTLDLHAGNAVVTAEELVKLDGAQIHVG